MSDWRTKLEEQVTPEHRDKVLRGAALLLKQNELAHKKTSGRRFFLSGLVGGLAAALAAVFVIFRPNGEETGAGVSNDFLATAPMVETNLDMLADLDIIDDMEVLENWEPS